MAKTKNKVAQAGTKVPISEIPEVQRVQDLKYEIDALKGEFPEPFMRLADLVDKYNTALELADKTVRSLGVSCGPFDNFSTTTKYNPDKMLDELGEELFLEVGGMFETVKTRKIDKAKLEAAIASNKIPKESLEHFTTIARSYHAPDKLVLP